MHKFVTMPSSTVLLEVHVAKQEVWMARLPSHHCEACYEHFTDKGQFEIKFKTIAHKLPIPILVGCSFCGERASLVHQGGLYRNRILESIKRLGDEKAPQ